MSVVVMPPETTLTMLTPQAMAADECWPPARIADVLDDTADYIEQYGWYQGSYTPGTQASLSQGKDAVAYVPPSSQLGQPACAYGAVVLSQHHRSPWNEWYVPMPVVHALVSTTGLPVDFWNDAEGRTKQDVLDTLRATAKDQRRLADEGTA